MDINGKNALVTGGGRGIGGAISTALAENGANVAVNYHNHKDCATEKAEEIREMGNEAMVVRADIASSSDVNEMCQRVEEEMGTVDILINNAGYIEGGQLRHVSEQQWDRMMAVGLKGPFLCTKAVAPGMREQEEGSIVNISSVAGWGMGALHYSVAKGGVFTLTKSVARDLSRYGINVNCVAPGPTVSGLGLSGPPSEERKKRKREGREKGGKIPMGRIGEPEDTAEAVILLVSNDFITGEILNVSGGFQTLYSELIM